MSSVSLLNGKGSHGAGHLVMKLETEAEQQTTYKTTNLPLNTTSKPQINVQPNCKDNRPANLQTTVPKLPKDDNIELAATCITMLWRAQENKALLETNSPHNCLQRVGIQDVKKTSFIVLLLIQLVLLLFLLLFVHLLLLRLLFRLQLRLWAHDLCYQKRHACGPPSK